MPAHRDWYFVLARAGLCPYLHIMILLLRAHCCCESRMNLKTFKSEKAPFPRHLQSVHLAVHLARWQLPDLPSLRLVSGGSVNLVLSGAQQKRETSIGVNSSNEAVHYARDSVAQIRKMDDLPRENVVLQYDQD